MTVETEVQGALKAWGELDRALKSAEKASKLDKDLAAAVERLKGSAKKT